jgi:acyl-CoA synthetase (NDP forming)
MPEATLIDRLLNPRSVAVVGATDDIRRIGGRPIHYMLSQGYEGRILPVNPKRPTVQGLIAYPDIDDLPEVPDVAVVAVSRDLALTAVERLARRGAAAAILFTAGFAEADADGAAAQQRLVEAARAHGMRLLGPNCLGLFNTAARFYGTFSAMLETGIPRGGPLAIVSQSGAFGTHLVYSARERGLGIGAAVMTGNEADLTMGEMVAAMVRQPEIGVIAVYSEGLREAGTLLGALEDARAAKKPVVMMKVGRSALGAATAQSHTASLANNDAVIDAVLAEFGVVRAESAEHLLDVAALATRRIYPAANTLGMFTISGGAGVLVSDAADRLGLPLPPMPESAQARLKQLLPYSNPRNPVDMTAQFLNDMPLFETFVEGLVRDGGYSAILGFLSYTGSVPSIAREIRAQLDRIRAAYPDRLYVLSLLGPPELKALYEEGGFAVYEDPTRAVAAIHAMGVFGAAFAKPPAAPPPVGAPVALPERSPTEAEAKRLLAGAGIVSAPEAVCATVDDATAAAERFGYPVVLKIVSPDIVHKSDIGGVLLDVGDRQAVADGFRLIMDRVRLARPEAAIEGILVARQLKGGVECIIGVQQDPVFGPVAMFGIGGVFVEILKDTALHRCPFDEAAAEALIRSTRAYPLLAGVRGRPRADVAALATMLARVSQFAAAAGPRLAALDLNPVLVLPEGEGAHAVDAVLEISSATPACPH